MKLKTLLQCIKMRGNLNEYIEFVNSADVEKILAQEPVCIKDKGSKDKELAETDYASILGRNEIHDVISEKYSLNEIAVGETDFERVLNVLKWLTDNTFYNGMQIIPLSDNSPDILEFSFGKPFKNAINCRLKAIAFADCLVAVGIKAYPVCMISSKFNYCHFTCQAYISELEKWCVFDPSFGCYFTDKSGNPIDIFEMRNIFIKGNQPTVCGYNFNGTTECFEVYVKSFLNACVSNLSTWQDNSPDRRTGRKWKHKKKFQSRIPR